MISCIFTRVVISNPNAPSQYRRVVQRLISDLGLGTMILALPVTLPLALVLMRKVPRSLLVLTRRK